MVDEQGVGDGVAGVDRRRAGGLEDLESRLDDPRLNVCGVALACRAGGAIELGTGRRGAAGAVGGVGRSAAAAEPGRVAVRAAGGTTGDPGGWSLQPAVSAAARSAVRAACDTRGMLPPRPSDSLYPEKYY